MKKINDPKVLKEWYDTEADWKMLIGYRFKGGLGSLRDGHSVGKRGAGLKQRSRGTKPVWGK